jgi:hypothetical protein
MKRLKESHGAVGAVQPSTQPSAAAGGPLAAGSDALPGNSRPADFYHEDRLAPWLGIARLRLSTIRRRALTEGVHWTVHNWTVVYTPEGLTLVRRLLRDMGVRLPSEITPPTEEPPAPVGPPEKVKVKVVRLYQNSRILQAMTLPADAAAQKPELVMVRVPDTAHFMPGMTFTAVHDVRTEHWQFTGRLPRRRGKW